MPNQELEQFKRETNDAIIKLKGQVDEQQRQIDFLKQENRNMSLKLENKNINFEDIKTYDLLKVNKLYAGIPIHTTSAGLKGFSGQAFIINAATTTPSKRIAFQIGSTVSSVALT